MEKAKFVQALSAGHKQIIVVYGCSLTEGGAWTVYLQGFLEGRYPGLVNFINAGKGSQCSLWGVENFKERVLTQKPDTVFIEFTMNDACQDFNLSPEGCRSNINFMIDSVLKQNPRVEVILQVMNPPTGIHLVARPNIMEYNQVYRSVAAGRGLLLIDYYANWEAILQKDEKLFFDYVLDGIHPVAKGVMNVIVPHLMAGLGIFQV